MVPSGCSCCTLNAPAPTTTTRQGRQRGDNEKGKEGRWQDNKGSACCQQVCNKSAGGYDSTTQVQRSSETVTKPWLQQVHQLWAHVFYSHHVLEHRPAGLAQAGPDEPSGWDSPPQGQQLATRCQVLCRRWASLAGYRVGAVPPGALARPASRCCCVCRLHCRDVLLLQGQPAAGKEARHTKLRTNMLSSRDDCHYTLHFEKTSNCTAALQHRVAALTATCTIGIKTFSSTTVAAV